MLVVVQDESKPQPATTLQRTWLLRDSPFFAPDGGGEDVRPLRGVCSFEIQLRDIAGLDYWNPLLVDASRLVIEASRVTRRWFPSLRSCSAHYRWDEEVMRQERDDRNAGTAAAQLAGLLHNLYRPHSGDDGRPPSLLQVVPQSENCRPNPSASQQTHSYWQEGLEEERFQRLNKVFLTAERMLRVKSDAANSPQVRPDEEPVSSSSMELLTSAEVGAPNNLAAEHDGGGGTGGSLEECGGSRSCSRSSLEAMPVMEVMYNLTVNFRFDDPFMPYVLREVVHCPEHTHLLRLCEAGLPAWAIFMPQYTGLYRRSMRIVVAAVLLLLSCVSMLLGFYDLYRRIPAVRALLKQVLGPLSSRLEELVVVRLSVLLGWMLPYSAIIRRSGHLLQVLFDGVRCVLEYFVWSLSSLLAITGSTLGPLFSALLHPFLGATSATKTLLSPLATAFRGAAWAVKRLAGASSSGAAAQLTTTGLLQAEFTLVRQAFMSVYNGTCLLGAKVAKHQASMRCSFARWRIRTRKRILQAARRRPVLTFLFVLSTAWLLRPPAVELGAGRTGFWSIGGKASLWISKSGMQDVDLHDPCKLLQKGLLLQIPSLDLFVFTACPAQVRSQESLQSRFGTISGASSVGYHSRRLWWWTVWDQLLADSLCPLIISTAVNGDFLRTQGQPSINDLLNSTRHSWASRRIEKLPHVRTVELLCLSNSGRMSSSLCWHFEAGGTRCHCPFQFFSGLNLTLDRPDPVVLFQASVPKARMHPLAFGVSCELQNWRRIHSHTTCLVSKADFLKYFSGGIVEFLAAPARLDLITSLSATFLLEAPRPEVSAPSDVTLCVRQGHVHWARLLPQCEGYRPTIQNQRVLQAILDVRWTRGHLGLCEHSEWTVSLLVNKSSPVRLCSRMLQHSSSQQSYLQESCSGAVLQDVWTESLQNGVSAAVTLHCLNSEDEPQMTSYSKRYLFQAPRPEQGTTVLSPLLYVSIVSLTQHWLFWFSIAFDLLLIIFSRLLFA